MTFRGIIGEIWEVRRSAGELFVDWRMPHFLSRPGVNRDHYESPRFTFCSGSWFMKLWPNFTEYGLVALRFFREDPGPPKLMNVELGLRRSRGVEKRKELEREFVKDDMWWMPSFLVRSELSKQKSSMMPNDTLTITCLMKLPGAATDVPVPKDEVKVITEESRSSEKREQKPSDECVICYEKPVDCALYRCGHTCMCYSCGFKLWKSSSSPQCPICRNSIQDVIKIYK